MKKKEEELIKSGMKLFARQGFSATSIQEIAAESNISKGSFYLYFKSKDDFLLAVLHYNFNTIQEQMAKYENKDLPAREKFEKQLTAVFAMLMEHRDFFVMLSTEQVVPRNEAIKEVIYENLAESHQFYCNGLAAIYGEKAEGHLEDLAIILEGLFHSYLRLLLVDPEGFEVEQLTLFIMRRMDSIVKDIPEEETFLSKQKMDSFFFKSRGMLEKKDIQTTIDQMRLEVNKLDNTEELLVSLDVLEEEIKKDTPRIPVIQGMLANFNEIDPLKPYKKEIASFYGFTLIGQ